MHSSTSSSSGESPHTGFRTPEAVVVREVPGSSWLRRFLVASVLTVVVIGVWEARVRAMGYEPTLNDTGDLWATVRSNLKPDSFVSIGSSRILFDLDLAQVAEYFDVETPIQLALPGGRPLSVLEHLAALDDFAGTVLVGVVPPLYFVPAGFPVDRADAAMHRYDDWSPSQRIGHRFARVLQHNLAFIQQEDLTLNQLLFSLEIKNREGANPNIPPLFPPYFQWVEDTRQAWTWEMCDFDSPLALRIQQIWPPLFTPPPPPPGVTPDEAREGYIASMEDILARSKAAVATIEGRGGRVIFLRFPSTGGVRELENQFAPRPGFWERILAETGAPGIHFEDYEELSHFDCPEWSHLRKVDARRYTRALLPLIERKFAES